MAAKAVAYGIIPLYTILFTRGYNWFTTNLSVIANFFDKKKAFFLWGMLVGGYYYMIHRKVKTLSNPGPVCSKLIPSALILLFCSITTPYLPDEMPFKAFLHIVFAFISTVLLFLYLLCVIIKQYKADPEHYLSFLIALIAVILISIILLVSVGIISSALEIFITMTTVILSDRLIDTMKGGNLPAPAPAPAAKSTA